jgi:hypothetical protein
MQFSRKLTNCKLVSLSFSFCLKPIAILGVYVYFKPGFDLVP